MNAANDQGSTPLHLAAVNGHEGVVRLLVAKGADTSVKVRAARSGPGRRAAAVPFL